MVINGSGACCVSLEKDDTLKLRGRKEEDLRKGGRGRKLAPLSARAQRKGRRRKKSELWGKAIPIDGFGAPESEWT